MSIQFTYDTNFRLRDLAEEKLEILLEEIRRVEILAGDSEGRQLQEKALRTLLTDLATVDQSVDNCHI